MSHFTVIVIGDDPENQLAPFSEQDEEYLEFKTVIKKDGQEEYCNGLKIKFEENLAEYKLDLTVLQKAKTLDDLNGVKEIRDANAWKQKDETVKETIKRLLTVTKDHIKYYKGHLSKIKKKEYGSVIESWDGYVENEKGEYGYRTNIDAKWDWYSLGGRWRGFFKLKEGAEGGELGESFETRMGKPDKNEKEGFVDRLQVKDWDLKGQIEEKRKSSEITYDLFLKRYNKEPKKDGGWPEKFNPYFEFGVENTTGTQESFVPESKENYLKARASITAHAILMDGTWHQQGEMGWFGHSTTEKNPGTWANECIKLLSSLDPETWISLYDCHI